MSDIWSMVLWMGLFNLYKVGFTPDEVTQMVNEMGLNNYITRFIQDNIPKIFDEALLLIMPSRSRYLN
jgi:hypothetical protein